MQQCNLLHFLEQNFQEDPQNASAGRTWWIYDGLQWGKVPQRMVLFRVRPFMKQNMALSLLLKREAVTPVR